MSDEDKLTLKIKENLKMRKDLEVSIENKKKEIYIWEKLCDDKKKELNKIEQSCHPIDTQYLKIKRALSKALSKRH